MRRRDVFDMTSKRSEYSASLKALMAFRRASRRISQQEGRAIHAHGLTPSQFGVLEVLYSDGALTVKDLLQCVLSTSGNMTVVLRNLERDGLVLRMENPHDGRSYLFNLTEQGSALMERVMPEHEQNVEEIFSGLTAQQIEQLTNLLSKLKG